MALGSGNSRQRSKAPVFGNEQVELRVDPIHGDLDNRVDYLQKRVASLKHVALQIDEETRSQSELLRQLEDTLSSARSNLKNTMGRLNRALAQGKSNYLLHVVLFALACFMLVYFWIKLSR